jgi:hypothetical protein
MKPMTLSQSHEARTADERLAYAADMKAVEAQKEVDAILARRSDIGVLCRKGKPVYYTFPAGGQYREAAHPSAL